MLKKNLPAILSLAFITIFQISCNNQTENKRHTYQCKKKSLLE